MSAIDRAARPQQLLRGVALIVAAMFVTSVQDVVFKLFSSSLTLGQIFALRALLAVPLLLVLAWFLGAGSGVLRDALRPWLLLRSLFMTLLFLAFYAAIPFVALSLLGAATYTAPIFVTLLSAYAIGEPVGRRGWLAVLLGFVGVVVLLQPGSEAFSPWALLPLLGAGFYALAHVITRSKCQAYPLPTLALSLQLVMLAAGVLVSGLVLLWQPDEALSQAYPYLLGGWSAVGLSDWLILALLAVLAVAIGLGIAGAYKAAPPAKVATFEYSYLVFAALWDTAIFATAPSAASLLGMLMIVAAGLLILHRG